MTTTNLELSINACGLCRSMCANSVTNERFLPLTRLCRKKNASEVPEHLPNTQRKLLHDLMMNFNSNITTLSRKKKGSFFAGTK
jgi:hypothetical protein